jgi:hypothetical protein
MKRSSILAAACAVIVSAVLPASAQVPAHERVRVTDPARLQEMGFAPDAENVYERLPSARERAPESTFGGATGFFSHAGMPSFQGNASGFVYDTSAQGVFCQAGTPAAFRFADIHLQPPNGAIFDRVSWWWRDVAATSSDSMTLFVFETCLPTSSAGAPDITELNSNSTPSASIGNGFTQIPVNLSPVNTRDCTYTVRLSFRGNAMDCIGNPLITYKVREEWRRQVSPPPGSATFNDVPTNHIFFRFVEALVRAGITGGCAAGQFCPGQPVTRGEMAAFISTALGLHWGGIP